MNNVKNNCLDLQNKQFNLYKKLLKECDSSMITYSKDLGLYILVFYKNSAPKFKFCFKTKQVAEVFRDKIFS